MVVTGWHLVGAFGLFLEKEAMLSLIIL